MHNSFKFWQFRNENDMNNVNEELFEMSVLAGYNRLRLKLDSFCFFEKKYFKLILKLDGAAILTQRYSNSLDLQENTMIAETLNKML